MLLRALRDYEHRLEPASGGMPPFYSETPIRYVIELGPDGRPLGRRPVDTSDAADPRRRRGTRKAAPQVQRTSAVRPLLLADGPDYSLGYAQGSARPERVAACHRAYLELLRECAVDTGSADVAAVLTFLDSNPLGRLDLPPDFDPGATLTFTVDGRLPIDDPAVQRFWASHNDPAARGGPVMQCLVCGRHRAVLDRLPGKVKGVRGGQSSGTAVISANRPAFESYGLSGSLVAPTCAECAEGFTRGANRLLADEATHVVIGSTTFIFWTRRPTTFSIRDTVIAPRPEAVRDLMAWATRGGRAPEVEDDAFYAAALSASGGRTVVRDWIDTTLSEAAGAIAAWHERQRIVDPWGDEWRPMGVFALAMATVREARDLAPTTTRTLLRAALLASPLPENLSYRAVQRCRAEGGVDRQRASLIKLVLLGRSQERGDVMVALNEDHPSGGYQCGRLLAVLEATQRAALGDVGAGIVDRFYGTASSAPLTVFPRLIRGAQPHLARLERDKPGAWRALQGRIEEVLGHLDGFPNTLTIEEQGLFALGYYHQRAADHERARAGAAARRTEGRTEPAGTQDTTDPDGSTQSHE